MNVDGQRHQGAIKRQISSGRSGQRTHVDILGRALPPQLVAGLAFLLVAWPIAWWGPAPVTYHTFFPLWLGYILTVDGIVLMRAGTSLLTRGHWHFIELFLLSAPMWWIFEGANSFLGNWEYHLANDYGFWIYHLLASISFSTVIPAVFETAELYRTTRVGMWRVRWWRFRPGPGGLAAIAVFGGLLFIGSLALPRVLFPAVWIGLFLLLDPINRLLDRPSLASQVAEGRWDTVVVLFAAGITCGFFWEMWNYWSMPKWTYHVPVTAGARLFEMPLLGYGGYLPFALELYAIYQIALAACGARRVGYLRFDRLPTAAAAARRPR